MPTSTACLLSRTAWERRLARMQFHARPANTLINRTSLFLSSSPFSAGHVLKMICSSKDCICKFLIQPAQIDRISICPSYLSLPVLDTFSDHLAYTKQQQQVSNLISNYESYLPSRIFHFLCCTHSHDHLTCATKQQQISRTLPACASLHPTQNVSEQ